MEVQRSNHWTTREVRDVSFLVCTSQKQLTAGIRAQYKNYTFAVKARSSVWNRVQHPGPMMLLGAHKHVPIATSFKVRRKQMNIIMNIS